ncbi:MAG: HesA/MoeB/ThiF family protein [Oligoflexales bacterium]|nr:HesA/MoeB/ThiF family protein [Oligoflexales bacterium]
MENVEEKIYYSKQRAAIGDAGQKHLQEKKVLVIGIGGLGCPAATYLASAGVGRLTLCDGDDLELSNLHRQTLFAYKDIGQKKSLLAKERLLSLNPFCQIQAIEKHVAADHVDSIIESHDLILDCTDKLSTKFFIHDRCLFLKKSLIQAGIYGGQAILQAFDGFHFGCMRCLWSEADDVKIQSCVDVGVLGAETGFIGSLQALTALKVLMKQETEILEYFFCIDIGQLNVMKIKRQRRVDCSYCKTY